MTRVKICGLTNLEDVDAAVRYGADALGFICVPESPRYVTPEKFNEIGRVIRLFVPRVAVVRRPEDAAGYDADYVQYYVDPEDPASLTKPGIRCFRMSGAESVDEVQSYKGSAIAYLLDAYHADKLGGSGESFNWDLAVQATMGSHPPILLAGGLTVDNVADAIRATRPYAVDIASGVEMAPGIKDHNKIRDFIRAVREYDLKRS